jgi:phytoene desaturase
MSEPRAVVVGAGLGGLAAAIRLAAAGWRVTLLEKNDAPGGKMGRRVLGDYVFDAGPTIFTLPDLVRELFAAAGEDADDEVTFLPVEPASHVAFPDGTVVETSSDLDRLQAMWARLDPRDAAAIPGFLLRGERIWRELDAGFFRRAWTPRDLLSPKVLGLGMRLDAGTTYRKRIDGLFHDPHLRHTLRYKSIYLGSTPESVPASFLSIPYLEIRYGVWHPRGGMHAVPLALGGLARRLGVELRYGETVTGTTIRERRVTEVITDGSTYPADAVVFNADVIHAHRDLLGLDTLVAGTRRRFDDLKPSSSAYILHLGVRQAFPDLHHHNVWHAPTYEDELRSIIADRVPRPDPTVYVYHAAATDPTARMAPAPDGTPRTALFVLTPTPPLHDPAWWDANRGTYREAILGRLEGLIGLRRDAIETWADWGPPEFASAHNAHLGSIFALAASFRQSAFFRPANRSPDIENAYFAGGGTQPGGGIPLVLLSGQIAAEAVVADAARSRGRRPAGSRA